MKKLKSEGKCLFCEQTFAQAGINRHLKTHFKEMEKTEKSGTSYLLKAQTNPRYESSGYFLYLWVNSTAKLADVDNYLRAIWLECCGHMSSFKDVDKKPKRGQGGGIWVFFEATELLEKGKTKEYEQLMEQSSGEIPMSRKVDKVFYKGQKLEYDYDFGSTTSLQITVEEELGISAPSKIVLLSRNEPLELMCEKCEKEPATDFCTAHGWNENSMFCPKCAKKHAKECPDFEDYGEMPVVNSPRMGVCGYEGGTIDKKRDGVFVKK